MILSLALLFGGCAKVDDTDEETDTDTDTDSDTDSDTDADTDADTDSDTDTDTGFIPEDTGHTGAPPTGCTDDSFEPNDVFAEAYAGASGLGIACPFNSDFYRYTVDAGESFAFVAEPAQFFQILRIQLYDEAGIEIPEDAIYNDSPDPIDIIVEVSGDPAFHTAYSFEARTASCELQDDAPSAGGDYVGLSVSSADTTDVFNYTVPAGHAIEVDALFDHVFGNIDLAMFGTTDVVESDSFSDDERLAWLNDGPADVDVSVHVTAGNNDIQCAPYDLVSEVYLPTCAPDGLEPNDSVGDATSSVGETGVMIEAGNIDYFEVTARAGTILSVEAVSTSDVGVDMRLDRDNGSTLVHGNPATYSNSGSQDEILYVRVEGATDGDAACGTYDLVLDEEDCDGDDFFEPNDNLSETPVCPGGTDFLLGTSDEDYFELAELGAGEQIELTYAYASGGDMVIELEDVLGNELTSVSSTINSGSISWTNTSPMPITVLLHTWHWTPPACSLPYEFSFTVN